MQANIYQPLRPVGGRLPGVWNFKENFSDLRQLDATKYRLIDRQVYLIYPDQLAICYQGRDHRLSPLFDISANRQASRDACNKAEVIIDEAPKKIAGFTIRSPYQILQFLGQVLRFQEEGRSNRCLTLSAHQRSCDLGEVLFQVNSPVGTPVIATKYASGLYAVNFRSCSKKFEEACDYSLEVLAILEMLLNFNKSAKDIVAIPRVQVVP